MIKPKPSAYRKILYLILIRTIPVSSREMQHRTPFISYKIVETNFSTCYFLLLRTDKMSREPNSL